MRFSFHLKACCLLAVFLGLVARADEAAVGVVKLVSPAAVAVRADSPSLTTAPDGTVWLSWLETDAKDETAVRCATLEPRTSRWSAARTIAHGRDLVTNVFDAPQLIVGPNGRATAVWSFAGSDGHRDVDTPRAFLSESIDGGITWSAPHVLTIESDQVEYVSLASLSDGGLLAVWIDGRGRKSEADPARLYARRLGSMSPDTLLDDRVCDCCRSSLTALPDGGALLAYRGRTRGEIRDILTARFQDGRWETARPSIGDHWTIPGCPVNGPRLARAELCVSRVWFTAVDNRPRVLVAQSTDAGAHFGDARPIDLGNAAGRVDTLVLHDGTQFFTWLENGATAAGAPTAGLYLRTVSASGATSAPIRLTSLDSDAVGRVFPRITVVKDDAALPVQIAVALNRPGKPNRIETLLVTFPRTLFPAIFRK